MPEPPIPPPHDPAADSDPAGAGTAGPGPVVFGVLGGIASGKSTVARLLAGPQGKVISADAIVQELLDGPELIERIRDRWGPDMLDPQGRPDRAALAGRVFSSAEDRKTLEGWIHPRVRDRIYADLAEARAAAMPRVALDVPLLLENDAQHQLMAQCDHLVFVEVSDEERDSRARANRGWATGEVARREAAQLPLADKQRVAAHVVSNDAGVRELERAVTALLAELGL